MTAIAGHAADDTTVDGVVYRWSPSDLAYIATGWDEATSIKSLHVRAVVNELDVVGIGNGAFEDNTDIVHVDIDEGITLIGENAFGRCTGLQSVIMPEGLETIGEEAFAFCTGLTTVVVPSTVTAVGSHAFMGCTGVTDAYFLMDDAAQLDAFGWWDGVYPATGEELHGGMEFNTVEHTVIHVPAGTLDDYVASGKFEAWLSAVIEDDGTYPLWWIVNHGVVGRSYTIADDLTGVYVNIDGGLHSKDDGRWLTPDRAAAGEVDYMASTGLLDNRGGNYDQSNWVVLTDLTAPDALMGHVITGGTVSGTLVDKRNPVIEVSSAPTASATTTYVYNTYIAASLMGRTQQGNDGRTYAFVRPKPQEVARIEWAIYHDDNEFYLPAPDDDGTFNVRDLKGGFTIGDALYEQPSLPNLVEGGYYPFDAVLRRTVTPPSSGSPMRRADRFTPYVGDKTTDYDVLPLKIDDDPMPTTVTDLDNDTDAPEHYYDLIGRPCDRPTPGILHIVVTPRGSRLTL